MRHAKPTSVMSDDVQVKPNAERPAHKESDSVDRVSIAHCIDADSG